jgi:hypothetical protein
MRGVIASLTCRYCGSDLEPEAPAQVSEVVAWLPVQCTKPACQRHYAIKVELLACPPRVAS